MVTHDDNVMLVGTGVDWVTATQTDTEKGRWLLSWGQQFVERQRREGDKVSRHALQGYSGERAGGALWGVRHDSVLVQCSGRMADHAFPVFAPFAGNVPRLDLAVTVERSRAAPGMVREAFETPGANGGDCRPVRSRLLVQAEDGGGTAYFGSPAARRRGRFYDKGVEQGTHPPGILHRYELQLRRDAGRIAASQLLGAADGPGFIQSAVHRYFQRVGLELPWKATDRPTARCVADGETSDHRRIGWLARSIGPCVKGLIERGHLAEVVRALQLQLHVDISLDRPTSNPGYVWQPEISTESRSSTQ